MSKSDYLRELRIRCGLTQQEVANKLGVTKATISKYEKGQRNVNPKHVDTLALLYGVGPAHIITGISDDVLARRLHEIGDKPIEMLTREEYEYVFQRDSNTDQQSIESKKETPSVSDEAMKVATAYDRADERTRQVVNLTLEPFMEQKHKAKIG